MESTPHVAVTISQHPFAAGAEIFAAVLFASTVGLMLVGHLLFNGPHAWVLEAISCVGTATTAFIVPLLSMQDAFKFEWSLVNNELFKLSRGPSTIVNHINLQDVICVHRYRQVPFMGRFWDVRLVTRHVRPEAQVLGEFFGVKMMGRAHQNETYNLRNIKATDLAKIDRAISGLAGRQ